MAVERTRTRAGRCLTRRAARKSPRQVDRERLVDLLGSEDLSWLRDRVRHRLEHGRPPVATVTLQHPTDGQRAAIDRLLGRRPSRGASVTVQLDAVGRLLRDAGICDGWRDAIEVLDGPVIDIAGHRCAVDDAWGRVLQPPDDAPPWWRSWLGDIADTGLLRRLAATPAHGAELLDRAGMVLDRLPTRGISLQRLAARALGDSHALDDDRPAATLVLKALQHRHLPVDQRGRCRPASTGDPSGRPRA